MVAGTQTLCFAGALVANHAHILLRADGTPLAAGTDKISSAPGIEFKQV